jgi:hypothetical protein
MIGRLVTGVLSSFINKILGVNGQNGGLKS